MCICIFCKLMFLQKNLWSILAPPKKFCAVKSSLQKSGVADLEDAYKRYYASYEPNITGRIGDPKKRRSIVFYPTAFKFVWYRVSTGTGLIFAPLVR